MGWEGNDFQGGVTYLAPLYKSNLKITDNRASGCRSHPHLRWSRNGERISILAISSLPTATIPTQFHYASRCFSINRNISIYQRCALFFRGCRLSLRLPKSKLYLYDGVPLSSIRAEFTNQINRLRQLSFLDVQTLCHTLTYLSGSASWSEFQEPQTIDCHFSGGWGRRIRVTPTQWLSESEMGTSFRIARHDFDQHTV